MGTFGQDLKKERELRGISLKEIADATKINLRFLRAIEEDNMSLLPGKFFIKGTLKTYVQYVGLDEDDVFNRYFLEEQRKQQLIKEQQEVKEKEKPRISDRTKNLMGFTAFVAVLVGVLVTAFLLFQNREANSQVEEIRTTPIPPKQSPLDVSDKSNRLLKTPRLRLRLSFQETTWIQLASDGEVVLDGNQPPGTELFFEADEEIIIHCGNLGGFTFSINGREGQKLGDSGEVQRNIRVTVQNWRDFLKQDGRIATAVDDG